MFLAARSTLPPGSTPAATLLGVPYDRTASFRRGARFGPAAIRRASQSIESYSPLLDRDLEEVALLDVGDLPVEHLPPEDMVEGVARAVGEAAGLPVVLGGTHTVTVGAVRALAERHPDLRVLLLDAHLDLREAYDGTRWSHACTTRRLAEVVGEERIALLGARAGTRDEFAAARRLLAAQRTLLVPHTLWTRLEESPLYLSVDVDVLDPAAAPGTGNPEPGGPAAEDLLALLRTLAPLRIVGLDLVEVAPPYDPSARTCILAATLVREALLTWTAPPQP